MPRPRKRRMVGGEPGVRFFKPQGVPLTKLSEVILTVEEYEALRLADLKGMSQEDAAKKMEISQPTFFRLIKSARSKVSRAIIEGKAIRIRGGDYVVRGRGRQGGRALGPSGQCVCSSCGTRVPHTTGAPCVEMACPKCGSKMVR